MKKIKILKKLSKRKLSIEEAYQKLFIDQKYAKQKRSKVKLHIKIKEHRLISFFINFIFIFPISTKRISKILKKNENFEFDMTDIEELLNCKGVSIELISDEANINIKTV